MRGEKFFFLPSAKDNKLLDLVLEEGSLIHVTIQIVEGSLVVDNVEIELPGEYRLPATQRTFGKLHRAAFQLANISYGRRSKNYVSEHPDFFEDLEDRWFKALLSCENGDCSTLKKMMEENHLDTFLPTNEHAATYLSSF